MRLLHRLRHVVFQHALVALGISFRKHRRRLAGTGGEDREETARPGMSHWVKYDAGNRVSHGAVDPLDNGLVRIGKQDAQIWVNCGLDIFAVTFRRERVRMDGAENERVRWLRGIWVNPMHPRTEHELRKLK